MIVEAKSDKLIDRVFKELYTPTFSHFENEYQDPEFYKTFLKPNDILQAYMLVHNPEEPNGFLIFEEYKKSKCALITYAAIKPSERGKGISRLLFEEAFRILKEKGILASYGEVHNPNMIDPQKDIMNPRQRINIFEKLGGQILPIKYVQPPLGEGLEPSRDFLLLTFQPEQGILNLYNFLYEFYQTLGIEKPENDENFLSMFR